MPSVLPWLVRRVRVGIRLRGRYRVSDLRDLLGNRVDFCPLLLDDMLFNLADIGVDLAQDVLLRLRQVPQLREQSVLPGGDAVHPPEADDPRTCPHPRQPVRDGLLIHSCLLTCGAPLQTEADRIGAHPAPDGPLLARERPRQSGVYLRVIAS